MEGKTNFSRRLKQFDGLSWLTLAPIFYDRSTPLHKRNGSVASRCVSRCGKLRVAWLSSWVIARWVAKLRRSRRARRTLGRSGAHHVRRGACTRQTGTLLLLLLLLLLWMLTGDHITSQPNFWRPIKTTPSCFTRTKYHGEIMARTLSRWL